jgi:hypothetical protein
MDSCSIAIEFPVESDGFAWSPLVVFSQLVGFAQQRKARLVENARFRFLVRGVWGNQWTTGGHHSTELEKRYNNLNFVSATLCDFLQKASSRLPQIETESTLTNEPVAAATEPNR